MSGFVWRAMVIATAAVASLGAAAIPAADGASAAGIGEKVVQADENKSDVPVYNRIEIYKDPYDSAKWKIATETETMNNTLNETVEINKIDYLVKYQIEGSNEWYTWIDKNVNIDYNKLGVYSKDIPPGPPKPFDEGKQGPRQYVTLDEVSKKSNIVNIESESIVEYKLLEKIGDESIEKYEDSSSSAEWKNSGSITKISPPEYSPEGDVADWDYWKIHEDSWPDEKHPSDEFYSSGKTWNEMLNTPLTGNSYYILGVQYMAAALNRDSGANVPQAIKSTMDSAEAWFSGRNPGQCAARGSCPQQKLWAEMLAEYNEAVNYKNGLPDYPPPRPGSEGFAVPVTG